MNKIVVKLFAIALFIVASSSACNNFLGDAANSALQAKRKIGDNMTTSEQGNPETAKDVRVSFSLIDSHLVLNQPILIKFAVQNGLGQTIKLDLGQNFKESFLFTVVYPDGKRIQLPQLKRREGISLKGDTTIESQKVYSQELLINEWVEFDKE